MLVICRCMLQLLFFVFFDSYKVTTRRRFSTASFFFFRLHLHVVPFSTFSEKRRVSKQ